MDRLPSGTLRGTMLDPLQLLGCADQPTLVDPANHLLLFYRGFWCEHCRAQLAGLATMAAEFRQVGMELAAISSDSRVLADAMCSLVAGQISIYRDRDAQIISAFGLADRDESVDYVIARPTVLIVGSDRTVEYCYISRSADDRPTSALLLLGAESLAAPW